MKDIDSRFALESAQITKQLRDSTYDKDGHVARLLASMRLLDLIQQTATHGREVFLRIGRFAKYSVILDTTETAQLNPGEAIRIVDLRDDFISHDDEKESQPYLLVTDGQHFYQMSVLEVSDIANEDGKVFIPGNAN